MKPKRRKWFFLFLSISTILLIYTQFSSIIDIFLFQPKTLNQDFTFEFNQPFEDIFLDTKDGGKLNAVFFPIDNAKASILYFHGNKGNLVRWGEIASKYTKYGYNVLVMDYRGYGKSTGERNLSTFKSDAVLWYDFLKNKTDGAPIISFGRSLGTGLASYIGKQKKVSAIILETPYISIPEVIDDHVPLIDPGGKTEYQISNSVHLKDCTAPVLIFHGTDDKVVPYYHGNSLASHFKHIDFVSILGGKHNNLGEFPEYWERLTAFLNAIDLKSHNTN